MKHRSTVTRKSWPGVAMQGARVHVQRNNGVRVQLPSQLTHQSFKGTSWWLLQRPSSISLALAAQIYTWGDHERLPGPP
jgi:hypothetical protein